MMIPLRYVKPNGKVDLWDLGPQARPEPPEAPKAPDEKLKGADLAAAQLEYDDACELYKDALRAYTVSKREHLDWNRRNEGPLKVELWGIDASHALDMEPMRYFLELPKGKKPGKAQEAADRAREQEQEDLKRARANDPQFGQGAVT